MSDEEQKESDNTWKHDQDLNFKKVTPHLNQILEGLQRVLNAKKAELAKMVGVRDRLRK